MPTHDRHAAALLTPPDPDTAASALADSFAERFGRAPEVLTAAPGRVNLIGEHVDYNAGRCLPVALPHATYAAVSARSDRLLRLTSLQSEEQAQIPLASLRPGAVGGWAAYAAGVVWALGEAWGSLDDLPGFEVLVDGHVPVGAGLSSSAALECSVAVAVSSLTGRADDVEARRRLVEACVRAEAEMAGAPTGGMDQSVALLAREGHALLLDFDDGSHRHVPWRPEEAGLQLLVVDTRVSHQLTDGGYAARRADCEAAARELGVASLRRAREADLEALHDDRVRRRARHVVTEMARVDAAADLLGRGLVHDLGPLLDESHASLRVDYEVSCDELDVAVAACRDAGALGARLTGAGFGGSAIALLPDDAVPPAVEETVRRFAARGWDMPRFLLAPASPAARRVT